MTLAHTTHVVLVGASHHTASLAARERLALSASSAAAMCAEMLAHEHVRELVTVSTCNRSEWYVVTDEPQAAITALLAAITRHAGLDDADIDTLLAAHLNERAFAHLFRVAGGIESVVTGEAQIQGQLRTAHQRALDDGSCGPVLDRLFRRALEIGKAARTDTNIGSGHASVGSVAADVVASHRGGSLHDARVLVLGAGKMGSLAVRSLAARGAQRIDVANRTVERAAQLVACSGTGGTGLALSELDEELATVDAVVSSTDAPHVVLTRERIERALARRGGRELVLVDLAVPRDIDPACASVPGAFVFDLDDLERVVAQTLTVRGEEVAKVDELARTGAAQFAAWLRAEAATPLVRSLRQQADDIRAREVARALAVLGDLSDEQRDAVEQLARAVCNGVLHASTRAVRQVMEHA